MRPQEASALEGKASHARAGNGSVHSGGLALLVHFLLEELALIGSVMTDREPRECVRLTLSDDLGGSPDFSRGDGGVHTLCATTTAGSA